MTSDDPQRPMYAALGRIPSGLFIVTAAHQGRETGMLASWLQQCSFKPPLVTFAVQPGREIVTLLDPGASIAVNILESSQTDLIAHFGKGFALADAAFNGLEVRRAEGKPPILLETLAYLECQIVDRLPAGDHHLFVAEVQAGNILDEGRPMVHVRKHGFHY